LGENTVVVFRFAIAAALACCSVPLAAQSLSPELQALEAQLPGTLVNDPSRIDWDSYGPEFYAESIKDDSIPGGGAARRFHVNQATEYIYTAGTNIPLIRPVKRGETITIGFWARTVSAATDDGKGVVRVRFQENSPPYPGFGEKTLAIGTSWEWYEVTAVAEQALQRKTGIVAIQFGRTKQILEIGQAIVISGASAIVSVPAPAIPKPAPAEAVAGLPKPLQGTGTLINDPALRDWTITAANGASQARDDGTIWLGKATQLATADQASGEALVQALIEVPGPLAKGEELLIAVAARTVSSTNADGKATLGVSLAAPAAGESFSSTAIALGNNWQLVRFVTSAPRDIAADEGAVALVVEGTGQAVDLGPVYVIRTGKTVE
jgi:hypothetical protein